MTLGALIRQRFRDRLSKRELATPEAVRDLLRRRGLGTGRCSIGIVTSLSPLTVEVNGEERVVDLRYPAVLALANLTNYKVGDVVEATDVGATAIGFKWVLA